MILADSSAWIEYDLAAGSTADLRLQQLIADDGPLSITEPVVMEVVAGARSNRRELALRRMLERFTLLEFDSTVDSDGASRIYRRCRTVGVTPRGLIDCMIAAVALRHDATLLAWDADIARIAQVMGIDLDTASLRPS